MICDQIEIAVNLLKQGKPVLFPTDTVYGLGADATSTAAIRSIFQLKNRPTTQALPVLLPDIQHIYHWIDEDSLNSCGLKTKLFNLVENFWPGPLTIVVKKSSKVSNLLTAGKDSIAIRIPNHPVTLELLKNFNSGIIGSSANKSGDASSKNFLQAQNAFDNKLFVLDGGECNIGTESTIVSLIDTPIIIRHGAITANKLANYL